MKEIEELLPTILLLLFIIISIVWLKFQWDLCIGEGLNNWYCIKHIL